MLTFRITIPIKPKPKASVRQKGRCFYNPSARGMIEVSKYVKARYKQPLMTGPLLVVAHFLLPLALSLKGDSRLDRDRMPHIVKPDGDNLEKFLNDALKGIVWNDDAQITIMLRTKSYTNHKRGGTHLFIAELDNAQFDYEEIDNYLADNLYIKGLEDEQS